MSAATPPAGAAPACDLSEMKQIQLALEQANAWLLEEMAQRRTAQAELETAYAELAAHSRDAEQASAAKTRFMASVSHELRTPLHTLLGFVRLSRQDADGDLRQYLAIAERSGTQLLKLIDELLEFAQGAERNLRLQIEAVALRDIVDHIEHAGSLMAAAQGNRYEVAAAADLPQGIRVDEPRLLQVLQNLIGNACKYTRRGTIRVRIEHARDDPAPLAAGNCRLLFAVDDSGAGIAEDEQAQIFAAFTRGRDDHGQPGLGLGLSIAQEWVHAMGGEIRVQSRLGAGSSFFFTLTLPRVPATLAPLCGGTAQSTPQRQEAPCTVLIVDDIAENRHLLRVLCRRWGFAVVEAADGIEALQVCRDSAPLAAVIVDQIMPRMGGWEFLCRLRAQNPGQRLPVALITAALAHRPADVPAAIDFDLVLDKPIDANALSIFLRGHPAAAMPTPLPAADAAAAPGIELPASELAAFAAMVDLGRVEAIAQWARALATASPAHADFADRVVQLCRAADVAALERLLATLTAPDAAAD